MNLQRIGDLAARYDISTRTLRYYEEIGLLWSERTDSQYRFYDEKAVRRLEQILLLRQLQLPIKDIQAILTSQDLQVAVDAFTAKLAAVDAELRDLSALREAVARFLALLQEKGFSHVNGNRLLEDVSAMRLTASPEQPPATATPLPSLSALDHVRIVDLKPMRVAWYRAESTSPEKDAWDVLLPWVRANDLDSLSTTRYFGFNNPDPAPGRSTYGYEVWISVSDQMQGSGPVQVKAFAGGLYAVTTTYLYEIGERWASLVRWVNAQPDLALDDRRCLEENVLPADMHRDQTQLDLFLPIRLGSSG